MLNFVLCLAVFCLPHDGPLVSQIELATVGGMTEFEINIPYSEMSDGRPSHSIEIDGDFEQIKWITPTRFVIANGCRARRITLNIRVTAWSEHRIMTDDASFEVSYPRMSAGLSKPAEILAAEAANSPSDALDKLAIKYQYTRAIGGFGSNLEGAKALMRAATTKFFEVRGADAENWREPLQKAGAAIAEINPKTTAEYKSIIQQMIAVLD